MRIILSGIEGQTGNLWVTFAPKFELSKSPKNHYHMHGNCRSQDPYPLSSRIDDFFATSAKEESLREAGKEEAEIGDSKENEKDRLDSMHARVGICRRACVTGACTGAFFAHHSFVSFANSSMALLVAGCTSWEITGRNSKKDDVVSGLTPPCLVRTYTFRGCIAALPSPTSLT